ncbi:MAG TPA: carbohydrate ABC transporter permease [Clostridiaceae bacterium]|nr:carbohydrate ABC transporter permease [Clostridiaceae bacterium]
MWEKLKKADKIDLILNFFIVIFALSNVFILYWTFANSFQYTYTIVKVPPELFPIRPTIHNFTNLFEGTNALKWTFNSLFVAATTTFLVVIMSSLSAYGFAKLKFFGRNTLFLILISTLMIPKEIIFIPLFQTTRALGLIGTYSSMILPNTAFPLGVFLMRQFYQSLPDELRESAKIDGAKEVTIFIKIIMPLGKAGLAALAIMTFISTWNDYLWQLILTTKESIKTLPIGIASLLQIINPDYGLRLAGSVVSVVPMLVLFIAFQKYFTKGITIGAVKG